MSEVVLLVEGPTDRIGVLQAILLAHGLSALVEAVGGCGSAGAVAGYLELRRPPVPVLAVLDRDYDPRTYAGWKSSTRTRYTWPRLELESYLLGPVVVARALDILAGKLGPRWPDTAPRGVSGALRLLRRCAQLRSVDEAGQLSVAALKQAMNNATGPRDVGVPKPPPRGRDAWIAALQAQAGACRRSCEGASALQDLTPPAVAALYDERLDAIQSETYLENLEFLVDFGGKELRQSVVDELSREGVRGSKASSVPDVLVAAFGACYRDGAFRPPEFDELVTRLRELGA